MKLIIRKAKVEDMLTVYEQICDLEDKVLNLNIFQKKYLFNISNKNIIYLVVTLNNKILVGFISCHMQDLLHHDKKVAEIQEFYVNKEFRGKGIGKMLMNTLVIKLKKRNCESMEVTAQNKRKNTHRFYSRIGLKQSHLKFIKIIE